MRDLYSKELSLFQVHSLGTARIFNFCAPVGHILQFLEMQVAMMIISCSKIYS